CVVHSHRAGRRDRGGSRQSARPRGGSGEPPGQASSGDSRGAGGGQADGEPLARSPRLYRRRRRPGDQGGRRIPDDRRDRMMIEPSGTALDAMEALQNWVDQFQGMWDLADSFYGSLNFSEAEALADLLAVAHRPDLAITL